MANNTSSLSATNQSDLVINPHHLAIFNITVTILAVSFNATTLLTFLTVSTLRSSAFNVYLICLTALNLFSAAAMGPLDAYSNLSPAWYLGRHTCTWYLHIQWTVVACQLHIHLAISVNRIWAVFWPISYRHKHTRHVAIALCIGLIVYCHAVNLPFLILDEIYYRPPEVDNGCGTSTTAQPLYSALLTLLNADAVLAFLILVLPVLLLKKQRVRAKKRVRVYPAGRKLNRSIRLFLWLPAYKLSKVVQKSYRVSVI